MTMIRRPQPAPDLVDVAARIAGYEATRTEGLDGAYASGYSRFALVQLPRPDQIPAPSDVLADRRTAPRYAVRLPARATAQSDEPWEHGITIDASLTGLCLEMDHRPSPGFLDVEIDGDATIAAWARVVAWTALDDGRYRWRLRLVSYDAGYPSLLAGREPIATGVAPAPEEPETAATDDRELVGAAHGWGPLLDRPTPKTRRRRTQGTR